MRWKVWLVVVGLAWWALCGTDNGHQRSELRVATFNIEMFPKNDRQVRGAFEAIAELDAAAIGVQEITKPGVFARAARTRLGKRWRFVYPRKHSPRQRVGVLYDSDALELLSTHTYRELQVYTGAKPGFEARFQPTGGGPILRMIVVHLKATSRGRDTREKQHRALRKIVANARAAGSGERLVVLGDFNATEPGDRDDLAALAAATDTVWASEPLECTAYWNKKHECPGSALDHVVTSEPAADITARGPCEEIGCHPGDSCPVFHREVSDHCPISVDFR